MINICTEYIKDFKYNNSNNLKEYNINIENRHLSREPQESLKQFLLNHKDKKINVRLKEKNISEDYIDKIIEFFNRIKLDEDFYDLKFSFLIPNEHIDKKYITKKLKNNYFNYFFETIAMDWNTVHKLLYFGASEIYIGGDLGFEIDAVSTFLHNKNIQVRAFPNVCQYNSWKGLYDVINFWIRPEDMEYYSLFIDIFEFWNSKHNLTTLYKIFTIDKKWDDDLSLIIYGLSKSLDSRAINNEIFSMSRASCGKRCQKGILCNLCFMAQDLSDKAFKRKIGMDVRNINLKN